MTTLTELIEALEKKGFEPKDHGTYWTSRCPCHDDKLASLSMTEKDGLLLVKCFSSTCEVHEEGIWPLLDKMGLKGDGPRRTKYIYQDEKGVPLLAVIRTDHVDGHKEIFQQALLPNGTDDPATKPGAKRRVLYRLPEIIEAVKRGLTIHICEGEKCVERIRRVWKEPATTPLGGASAPWNDEDSALFDGVDVVVWQDNDEPGERWAKEVATSVAMFANRVEIRKAQLDEPKSDVADMIDYGLAPDQYDVVETLDTIWPIPIKRLNEVVPCEVEWIVPGVIPKGELTIIEGPPGCGKTMALLAMVAALTLDDGPLPHGEYNREAKLIWYITTEDRADVLIAPRLARIGGDPSRIIVTDDWDGCMDGDGLGRFKSMMRRLKPDLVVIDAFLDVVLPAVSADSPKEVKPILKALRRTVVQHDSSMALVRHVTKASSKTKTVDMEDGYGGSHYSQAARGQIRAIPGDVPGTITLIQVKNNYGVKEPAFTGNLGATLGDFWDEPGNYAGIAAPLDVAKEIMLSMLMAGPQRTDDLKRTLEASGMYGGLVFDVKNAGILDISCSKSASGVWTWSLNG